jgi:hypothetical protein
MTNTRDIVTRQLLKRLPAEFDACLASAGFQRAANSLEYARVLPDGTQHFKLVFDVNPRYEVRALAHVLPQIRFVSPELNQRVLDMMGTYPSLEDKNGVTYRVQIQNAAPRDVRIAAPRWCVFDDASAGECLVSIREFVNRWSLPFLDKYTSIAELARGYEEHDDRLPHDRRFVLFMVAAYTLLQQPEMAMRVLENVFGRPGSRREYAKAFEFVEKLLAK